MVPSKSKCSNTHAERTCGPYIADVLLPVEAGGRGTGRRLYGCNVCGEGGEYETLTLDCSLFELGSIVLDAWEMRVHSLDALAPVGVLHPLRFHVIPKSWPAPAVPLMSAFAPRSLIPLGLEVADAPSGDPAAWLASQEEVATVRTAGSLPACLERVPKLGDTGLVAGHAEDSDVSGLLGSPGEVARSGFTVAQATSIEELFRLGHAMSLPSSFGTLLLCGDRGSLPLGGLGAWAKSPGSSLLGDSPEDFNGKLDGLPEILEEGSGQLRVLCGSPGVNGGAQNLPEGLTAWVIDVPDDFRVALPPAEELRGRAGEAGGEPAARGDGGADCVAASRWTAGGGQVWCVARGRGASTEERVVDALACVLSRLENGTASRLPSCLQRLVLGHVSRGLLGEKTGEKIRVERGRRGGGGREGRGARK
jgi:hypothetical protein